MSHLESAFNSLDSIFGCGSSGSATYSSSHNFEDSAYTNLTINTNAVYYAHGVRIFVNGTMTIETQNISIQATGSQGGSGTPGYLGGTGGTAAAIPSSTAYTVCVGSQGEGGSLLSGAVCDAPQPVGCQHQYILGGRGGVGGNGGVGVWGENYEDFGISKYTATPIRPNLPLHPDILFDGRLGLSTWYAGQGGSGGGAGGGCAYVDVGSPNGAGGGAGGNGGGMIVLFVKKLVLNTSLYLWAKGGLGGNGTYGTNVPTDGNGAGGSGGGGGGGCVILVIGERSGSGSLTVDVSGGNAYYGYSSGGLGGYSEGGRGGSRGSLWYVNLAAGISTRYAASDAAQSGITGESGAYTLY